VTYQTVCHITNHVFCFALTVDSYVTDSAVNCVCCYAVTDVLLSQGTADIAGHEFVLSAATQQLQDEQDAKWRSRTVLVKNVPDDMKETVLMFLENKRKGGGEIEATKTDECSRTVMVTFREADGMSLDAV